VLALTNATKITRLVRLTKSLQILMHSRVNPYRFSKEKYEN
jgi:hypothetical protein